MNLPAHVQRYMSAFDNLTPGTTGDLRKIVHPGIEFVDPFNHLHGAEPMIAVMDKMYADTENPKFETRHVFVDGDTAIIRWRFTCGVRFLGVLDVEGVSEVTFDEQGLATRHVDYWDASLPVYGRVPVLGMLIRLLRKRIGL